MPVDLSEVLVIGISSRALFDLELENNIYLNEGIPAYKKYQLENENIPLEKGTAFHLIESLLKINTTDEGRGLIEVVVMSRNSPDTGLRVLNSIKHYGLPITRSAFTSGVSLSHYVDAFSVDLFLSKLEIDIRNIIDSGKCAAALIYNPPVGYIPDNQTVRIAFDADAVIFSEESELIYKKKGLSEFHEHEHLLEDIPLSEGPFGKFFKLLSKVQSKVGNGKIRIAIVTARDYPANIRVIKTLRKWGIDVDEAFFLGGLPKDSILKSFNAHIFFDDQDSYVSSASCKVPSSRVPYKRHSPLDDLTNLILYKKTLGLKLIKAQAHEGVMS